MEKETKDMSINVRVTKADYEYVEAIAIAEDRSMSSVISRMVKAVIQKDNRLAREPQTSKE